MLRLDPEDLRNHYASLPDAVLMEVNRDDLVEIAQKIYDEEVSRRGLDSESSDEFQDDDEEATPRSPLTKNVSHELEIDGDPPDWIERGSCIWTATAKGDAPLDLVDVCDALRAASIPYHVSTNRVEDSESERFEFWVMVPGGLYLHALAILDRDFLNAREEDAWLKHLQWLSADELRVLDPEVFCAGFLDRAERLKRLVKEEMARRKNADDQGSLGATR